MHMPNENIRVACVDDIPQLLNFEQQLIAAERPFALTLKDGDIHYYNLESFINSPDTQLLIVEIDGLAVACGYAQIRDTEPHHNSEQHAYLGFMYVEAAYRGQGLIQKITNELQAWSMQRGVRHFRLDVFSTNRAAIRAYEKSGFQNQMTEMVMEL